ncbi:hypothetical protein B0H13DRAFT_2344299 [Mycena leptocephala]|nr:hypothetical protein B0H13DRAFT_2344299 [Mycena leptocephala]
MGFPKTFDAYIPSNGPNFLSISNINPNYVPLETLSTITFSNPASTASFVTKQIDFLSSSYSFLSVVLRPFGSRMHQCLQTPELLRTIFQHVAELSPDGGQGLARLAITCLHFKDPALDQLWRRQASIIPSSVAYPLISGT